MAPSFIRTLSTRPWRVVVFLFVAGGFNYADRTVLSSVIPPLQQDLGASSAQIGLAGMLFLWSYALASPFAGNFADRYSRSRLIVLSLFVWSVITVLTGLASSMTMLYACRTALGLAESFYLPAATALLAAHHGMSTRGKAMSLHILGMTLGLVVGGSIAGYLAEHYGWRVGFVALGSMGMILCSVARFFLTDGPDEVRPAAPVTAHRAGLRETWLYLARVPSFHCLILSAMVAGVASWVFLSWLPLFFAENYHLDLGAAALAGVALYKMPVFIGIAIGGWLSDRVIQWDIRARALIKGLSYLGSAPFLFLFMGAPTFTLVAATLVISSIIRSTGLPSEHAILCEVAPPQFRSTAMGILNTFGSAAGGLGVLLTGIFKQQLGLNVIFGASSFIYILAGVLMLLAYRFSMARDMARADQFALLNLADDKAGALSPRQTQ